MTLLVDLGRDDPGCGPDCPAFVDRWATFWREQTAPDRAPIAVMTCAGYLASLSSNARKLARRANARYDLREFDYNAHLEDIQNLNASRTVTSQGPTTGFLRRAVRPQPVLELCDLHAERWYGGFDQDGVLRGYWSIAKLNRLGTSIWLFRHAEHSDYVLNGLAAHIAAHADVDHVTYHIMQAAPNTGRPEFKRRIGCREQRLVLA